MRRITSRSRSRRGILLPDRGRDGPSRSTSQGHPRPKGEWGRTEERSGVVGRGNRWEHKSPPTNGEVVFGSPLTWSLTVERQEGVAFSGTWASQNNTDPMVGAVSADGKTLYLADDNGPMHGELRGPDQMEICRSLAEPDADAGLLPDL